MMPVSVWSSWQFFPAFNQQYARIADLAWPPLKYLEAFGEVGLVPFAIRKTWTRRFGPTYTTALDAAVDLWFMEAEHLGQYTYKNTAQINI